MPDMSPTAELALACWRALYDDDFDRLERALDRGDLPADAAGVAERGRTYLSAPTPENWNALSVALGVWCRRVSPLPPRPATLEDFAALAGEPPAWTARADIG